MIDIDYNKFIRKDNRNLVKGFQLLTKFKGDLSKLDDLELSIDAAIVLANITGVNRLKEIILEKYEEGEKIIMMESMVRYRNECIDLGFKKGEKKGIKQGEEQGIKKGISQGMTNLLISLLKTRFELSNETINLIKSCSVEKLLKLSKIYDLIHDEESLTRVLKH